MSTHDPILADGEALLAEIERREREREQRRRTLKTLTWTDEKGGTYTKRVQRYSVR